MGGPGSGRKKGRLTRKQLEARMSPKQLIKLNTHYGMGVVGHELTRTYKGKSSKKKKKKRRKK